MPAELTLFGKNPRLRQLAKLAIATCLTVPPPNVCAKKTSVPGTNRPCRLPLGLVRKLGSSCQWCARSADLQQWKVDRPSATRRSRGEDDPLRSFTMQRGIKVSFLAIARA